MNKEKFKGHFQLKVNENMPMNKKIEKYGLDPVAFHLHKNRNFMKKIQELGNGKTEEDGL